MKNDLNHIGAGVIKRKDLDLRAGDTVRVSLKIKEKGKVRLQAFEGLVIAVKHGKEAGGTFTVRKVASGVGVERIFPLYSPSIDKIDILRRSQARRAKLYFIRDKVSKEISRKMRRQRLVKGGAETDDTNESEIEATATAATEAEKIAEEALA
ncbi:MAG: 50S ribosomal protein L19 [Candidatus Vogelbacteria bacterium]|nr:50S ribosomal protein L19 [Candidatus Vogelbacteria bacterium]